MMSEGYTSIFLEEGWAHQKYYGWTLIQSAPGFRVLEIKRGAVRRRLVLSNGLSGGELDRMMSAGRLLGPLCDITVHDFSDPGQDKRTFAGRVWTRAEKTDRLLNIATFAVDLSRDEPSLFQSLSSDYRRKIKKARESGLVVVAETNPSPEQLDLFAARYRQMAADQGIAMPDMAAIQRMFANGDLILFTVREGADILNALAVYTAGNKSIFLYGVAGEKRNDGSGQLMHWEAILNLKARGFHWYDLGGLAQIDDQNGIYRFKKGFGGALVPLGTEYVYRPPALKLALKLRTRLRGVR